MYFFLYDIYSEIKEGTMKYVRIDDIQAEVKVGSHRFVMFACSVTVNSAIVIMEDF